MNYSYFGNNTEMKKILNITAIDEALTVHNDLQFVPKKIC